MIGGRSRVQPRGSLISKLLGTFAICVNITKYVLRYLRNRVKNIAFFVYRDHLEPLIIISRKAYGHRLTLFLMLEWTRLVDAANAQYLRIRGRKFRYFSPFRTDFVKTTSGAFRIRSRSRDLLICSPIYEYGDRQYLISLIQRLRNQRKRVLFLDIGAAFGIYTISTGYFFREDEGVSIMSFEPAAPSYGLLTENIELNDLSKKVVAYNLALSDEEGTAIFHYDRYWANSGPITPGFEHLPEAYVTRLCTLDSIIHTAVDYDVAIMKVGVEGAEIRVLKGAQGVLDSGKSVYILIEDSFDSELRDYLEGLGATPIGKFTCENS